MFKSVLAAVKPSSTQNYIIDFAVALAARLGAELTACAVIDVDQIAPPEPVPIGAGAFKKEHDEELVATAREEAAALLDQCSDAATQAGVPCRIELLEGDLVELLSGRSHEHDLLIVGHSAADDEGDESLFYRLLQQTPRPAVLFPKKPIVGRDVVVAYDGSMQAGRALSSFADSGLGVGRTVHVLACDDEPQRAAELCDVACRYLGRHGLATVAHPESRSIRPAEALCKLADTVDAELLVMGAFGARTVREFFFGSTTQRLLRELPRPVFVDH